MTTDVTGPTGGAVESKGLKSGALGLASTVVIGVASTAPAYSLAATLGFVTYYVGLKAPAVMWLAFVPMGCIASAFFYLNRADPDCGTNFSWVTRAMGPRWGWMGGWSSMMADLIVMPSLAFIAAQYTFLLFGWDSLANNTACMLILGIAFIMGMTWICVVGIELSARTQLGLLATEVAVLVLFSGVALWKAFDGSAGFIRPEWSWLTPTDLGGVSALSSALLIAVFIYWGWDTASSVNEECEGSNTTPGLAGVLSTFILVAIFVITTIAAQSVRGADYLSDNPDDVLHATGKIVFGESGFGTLWFKLLIISVLTSAAASCQTTILPAARTALSMAIHRAFPPKFGEVDHRHLTPGFSTWVFGILSSVFFTALMIVGRYSHGDVLTWAADSVGLMIAYYYGQTGFACVIYYRKHLFKSVKNFVFVGLLPLIGGLTLAFIFLWGLKNFSDPAWEDPPTSWFGFSPVLWIGVGTLLAGIPIMFWWGSKDHAFFRVKPDPIDRRPPPEGGAPLPALVADGAAR